MNTMKIPDRYGLSRTTHLPIIEFFSDPIIRSESYIEAMNCTAAADLHLGKRALDGQNTSVIIKLQVWLAVNVPDGQHVADSGF